MDRESVIFDIFEIKIEYVNPTNHVTESEASGCISEGIEFCQTPRRLGVTSLIHVCRSPLGATQTTTGSLSTYLVSARKSATN